MWKIKIICDSGDCLLKNSQSREKSFWWELISALYFNIKNYTVIEGLLAMAGGRGQGYIVQYNLCRFKNASSNG